MLEGCFLFGSFIGIMNYELQTVYKYDCNETEKNIIFNKDTYKEVKVIKSYIKDSKIVYEVKG